jgi:hypothetical protein
MFHRERMQMHLVRCASILSWGDAMMQGYAARLLAALLLAFVHSPGHAIPIGNPLADPFIGLDFDFSVNAAFPATETMHYDSASQRLSYAAAGTFDLLFDTVERFPGFFAWEASINSAGEVLDSGSMLWFGDLGAGNQLLATGKVRDIGFHSSAHTNEGFDYFSFRAVFENLFLSPEVAGFGPRMGLFFELSLLGLDAPIFSSNFACDLRVPTQCPADGSGSGAYFSTSGVAKIEVPEPPAFALLAFAVVALGTGRAYMGARRSS